MTTLGFVAIGVLLLIGLVAIGVGIWKHQGGHKHAGIETGRRFVPGMMETGGSGRGFISPDLIYGYTEVSYRCEVCGHRFINRYVGKLID